MLYRFPVREIKGGLKRGRNYLVVVMQYYPRFISKTAIDEYVHDLAPERELFTEFKSLDRELKDHNLAFDRVGYENRFSLTPIGREHLERLSTLSKDREILLFCQCELHEKCHADLLLLMAKHWFNARTSTLRVEYPIFMKRLQKESKDLIR